MAKPRKITCSNELMCGIDGGGTSTKVVVCKLDGLIVQSFQTGTINHYGAGIEKVRENFARIASTIIEKFDCLPGVVFTGNSALDGLADAETVQELTGGVFHAAKVIFHSDVYIALLSHTMGKQGAVLISGTGSMACGMDKQGVYHTAGGWGQILGDEGSAYHLALEGIKSALRAYDGLTEATQLTKRVMEFFQLSKMSDIIDIIYKPDMEKSLIASFAPEVEMAAEQGDDVANALIDNEAEWLYKLALVITGKCQTRKLGCFGSVLRQNDRIRSRVSSLLEAKSISLKLPEFAPEIGALIGAFLESGNKLTHAVIDNFMTYRMN